MPIGFGRAGGGVGGVGFMSVPGDGTIVEAVIDEVVE
jgi:hypothetical protein